MAIDRNKVIEDMSKVKAEANPDGIIPAFNVLANQLPAKFWNGFSRRMVDAVSDEVKDAVEELLINAVHEWLGTSPAGTIRFSLSRFTAERDIDVALDALRRMLHETH
jgi:hypothetical protein